MNRKKSFVRAACLLWLLAAFVAGCGESGESTTEPEVELELTSSAIAPGANIPVLYSCDGQDVSPPLQWTGAPAGTQSFVLIMDDPDAPGGTFVHWVLFNVPAATGALAQAVSPGGTLPAGSLEGVNSFGDRGYGGPCPPPGSNHRYFFRLYALNAALTLTAGATRAQVDQALSGRVLDQTELMGRYAR